MSFATEVKDDLCRVSTAKGCCKRAELAAFVLFNGSLRLGLGNKLALSLQTEHSATARHIYSLAKEVYNMNTEIVVHRKDKLKKNQVFSLFMPPQEGVQQVLDDLSWNRESIFAVNSESKPLAAVWHNNCCKRAFLRGAFLASGSVCAPQSGYHLEIVCNAAAQAQFLNELLEHFELRAGIVPRKQAHIFYLKESEQIITFLALIGAHRTMLDFENVRIGKEIRNNVQRMLNAENANLDKTAEAAARQLEAIRSLAVCPGLERLSPSLREAAEMRLEYPEATLSELGQLMSIGKSGVNHRLRKLVELAASYAEDNRE